MAKTFTETSIYQMQDAMSWELYKSSLNNYLSDAAEADIISRFPDETNGLISITSNIEIVGRSGFYSNMSQDELAFLVTIVFSDEEN